MHIKGWEKSETKQSGGKPNIHQEIANPDVLCSQKYSESALIFKSQLMITDKG